MNCREFKEQFEDGSNLNREAKAHIKSCLNCETYQIENLQLTQMISSLPSVKAPSDFEFGFKAKLAKAQLNKPLSPMWRILRYLFPLTAGALIFGFVIVNSNLFAPAENPQTAKSINVNDGNNSILAQQNSFDEPQPISPSELTAANRQEEIKPNTETPTEISAGRIDQADKAITKIVAENKTKEKKKEATSDEKIISRDTNSESNGSMMFDKDLALSIPKPINPPGINPDKKIYTSPMSQNAKPFTSSDILAELGITTSNQVDGLRVVSVRKNSAGANSGVQIGDIILAIDGQALSNKPLQNQSVQGKSLMVKRGTMTLNITIKN